MARMKSERNDPAFNIELTFSNTLANSQMEFDRLRDGEGRITAVIVVAAYSGNSEYSWN